MYRLHNAGVLQIWLEYNQLIFLIHFARGYNIILLTIYEGIKYNCDINLPLSSSAKHYNTLTTDKLDFGAYLS